MDVDRTYQRGKWKQQGFTVLVQFYPNEFPPNPKCETLLIKPQIPQFISAVAAVHFFEQKWETRGESNEEVVGAVPEERND